MFGQKKIGVILAYAGQVVHILTNLLYVPIMLRILGQSEYGLYQLAASVVSNLNILSMGFSSSYVRFFTRYKSKGDEKAISKLNGMFMTIFLVIALVCLLCGFFLIANARWILGEKLSNNELEKAKILIFVLVISMAITFITSVFQCQISAVEKFVWLKGVDLFSYIVNPVVALPLLLLGHGSVGMVIATLSVSIAVCLLDFYYVKYKIKASFSFKGFDFSLFKEMSGFTFYIFLNIVIEQINWSIDKFLLGRMRGTNAVAVYGVGSQIISLYRSISGTIRGVFVPQINWMVAEGKSMKLIDELLIRLGRIIYLVSFLICSGFLVFGKKFVFFWAGEGYEKAYYVALISMLVLIVPIIQGPGLDLQRAMNKHKARSIVYFFIAIGNMFLSIPLIRIYGEIGASIGTAIALVLGNWLFMNYYYRRLGLNIMAFWKSIMKMLPASVLVIIVGGIISSILPCNSMFEMSGVIAIYVVVYGIIFYLIGLNKQEKEMIKNMIRKLPILGR